MALHYLFSHRKAHIVNQAPRDYYYIPFTKNQKPAILLYKLVFALYINNSMQLAPYYYDGVHYRKYMHIIR